MTTAPQDGKHRTDALAPRYKIVRFYQDERPRVTRARGLTLEQAQAHCQREDTHGPGWFDGYEEEH